MKLIIRVFNIVIMALAAVATIFLFASPAFYFNSRIDLDVKTFSQFVPETTYSKDIKIEELLGTDTIHVRIKFNLSASNLNEIMDGNRDDINDKIINDNVKDMLEILHEPVDLITDFSIRSILKSTIKTEVTKQVDDAKKRYEEKSHQTSPSTTEDIMLDAGMDDAYFTRFANAFYDEANSDGATIDSVNDVLYEQIDEALTKAKKSGAKIDTTEFNEEIKTSIKENIEPIFQQLNLLESDGHLKKISQISYLYLSSFLKDELNGKSGVKEVELEQKSGESIPDYSDRLLGIYVCTQMPDVFYTAVGYISLGLFIGLFVFTGIWVFLFVWTLIKTFTKKPWTFFGPIFWLVGLLQLVLGLGLTVAGRVVLPKLLDSTINLKDLNLPISDLAIAPRTYALVPSILYLVCIVVAIVYVVFKSIAKSEYKDQQRQLKVGGK